ncbi:ROK family transcriptional regulator [Phyllobacterium sp. P5_D12]
MSRGSSCEVISGQILKRYPLKTIAAPIVHQPLTESARSVLKMISRSGPVTRPQLSAALAFSKPTMSAAVGELEAHGLVASNGVARGAVGRTAVTYGLGAGAGFAIGVDCGTTQIHAMASKLDGQNFVELQQPVGVDGENAVQRFQAIETAIESLLAQCGKSHGPLRVIAIALPNIISQTLERLPARDDFAQTLQRLQDAYNVPIVVENNVNCAALAEYHEGAAKHHSFAIYLQIGVKVGVGIVLDGKLFRGFRGGAGEVGHLPFPWSETEKPRFQQVETYLGSVQLLQRCKENWPASEGKPPVSTAELFSLAQTSDYARRWVERHANDIGNLVASCVSILDPELVVLGGGVGQNAILLEGVDKVVRELCWPVEIRVSELSNQATVLGAMRLGVDFAMAGLLGEDSSAAFLYPGTLAEPVRQ